MSRIAGKMEQPIDTGRDDGTLAVQPSCHIKMALGAGEMDRVHAIFSDGGDVGALAM